ncbi:MAG: rhodanese-like domain-containing protein [Thermoanaerobaculia bacterium]
MSLARRLLDLSPPSRLALLALVGGLGALAIGDPASSSRVTLDTRELASIVQSEVDHVSPDELADWIIVGRQDFRLVDLRSESEFAAYHIPGAERISIVDLVDAALPRNERIVLYSAEGIHSAQAWFLLRAKRYPAVYILLGGLKQWREEVLFPTQPSAGASPTGITAFAAAAERARFFGGQPVAAAAGTAAAALAPALAPPAIVAPSAKAGAPIVKKKKEGC